MTLTVDRRSELQELLDLFVAGSLAHAGCGRLNAILQDCEEAQLVYLDHMSMHAALTVHMSAQPAPAMLLNLLESAQADAPKCDSSVTARRSAPPAEVITRRPASPVLGFLGGVTHSLSRPVFWSIVGVGVLFAGYFVSISWNMLSKNVASAPGRDSTSVATIHDTANVKWSTNSHPRFADAPIRKAEPMQIESGIVELQLKQGATLIVEGPAQWSIDGENRATLKTGKLVAKVPHAAVGFRLTTPAATIVDLGTEFGVEVNKTGATDVQVIKGRVELHLETSNVETTAPKPVTLTAGSARRVELDRTAGIPVVREIAPQPRRFSIERKGQWRSRRLTVAGALASSQHTLNRTVNHLTDGSGLDGEAHTNIAEDTMWHTALGRVKGEFVLFDLGRLCRLESMKVWNFNENVHPEGTHLTQLFMERGVAQADIYTSISGKGDPLSSPQEWSLRVADRKFPLADGTPKYAKPETIPLNNVEARFAAIVIDERLRHERESATMANECVGLSEVQFFGETIQTSERSGKK